MNAKQKAANKRRSEKMLAGQRRKRLAKQYNRVNYLNLFSPVMSAVNSLVITLSPFDFHLTKEILEIKLSGRGKMLKMDYGDNDFVAHFSKDGKYQLTWRFGEDLGFYFCKNGVIQNRIIF
jgi:hypothetical protein